jgi:hypothetical protein
MCKFRAPVRRETEFCILASNIFGASVRIVLRFTFLGAGIVRCLIIYAPLELSYAGVPSLLAQSGHGQCFLVKWLSLTENVQGALQMAEETGSQPTSHQPLCTNRAVCCSNFLYTRWYRFRMPVSVFGPRTDTIYRSSDKPSFDIINFETAHK